MRGTELALVFFTVIIQAAVGMTFFFGIAGSSAVWKNSLAANKIVSDKILYLICALFTLGLIISFLHLGNVKNAFYAFNNLKTSWLSREILFASMYGAFLFLFTFIYAKNLLSIPLQNIMLILSAAAGIVLVFVMSRVYMIEFVPAWNSMFTPLNFYLTSFIAGGAVFIAAFSFLLNKYGMQGEQNILKIMSAALFLLILAGLIIWLLQILFLSNGGRGAVDSYNLFIQHNILLASVRIILLIAALILLASFYMGLKKGIVSVNYIYIASAAAVIAELAGRYIFYFIFAKIGV